MFHPGRVVSIFGPRDRSIESADGGTQAMLEMWDDNMITVSVDPHLTEKVKKDDIVLVDYSTPKLNVMKILRGELGKQTWKKYKERFEKRKPQQMAIPMPRPKQQSEQYVG